MLILKQATCNCNLLVVQFFFFSFPKRIQAPVPFSFVCKIIMASKRSRESDVSTPFRIPPPSLQQHVAQAIPKIEAVEALPTLTNWGGGHGEGGKVVSNARLTNQQRSTIHRAVCTYFLQNKSVPATIFSYRFIGMCSHSCPLSDVAKVQIANTVTMLLCPSKKKCKDLMASCSCCS